MRITLRSINCVLPHSFFHHGCNKTDTLTYITASLFVYV